MVDLEKACYKKLSIPEFIGNPLIEALPVEIPPGEYPEKLLVYPPYEEKSRKAPPEVRLQALQRISQIHVPTRADSMMMLEIRRCLNWGYVSRNPLPFDQIEAALAAQDITLTDSLRHYLKRFSAPVYGFPVLGVSGIGKTTSIDNLMTLYPQVIEHSEYRGQPFQTRQLVWLKVECPGDGTPKGLCHSILTSIDLAMGTDYARQIVKNRMSKDVLTIKVSQLLHSLHLGILLIDDIQNLMSAVSSVSAELLSFMVALTNNLKIPVVMIGTPKITKLLQKEFQMAKRATGEGEVRMMPMTNGSREWELFMKVLWRFQFTCHKVRLTNAMREAFFAECVGIPFLAAILYKVVQDDAIISTAESFKVSDVHRVAQEKLGLTAQKRRDMRMGEDVEFNEIMSLWAPASKPPQVDHVATVNNEIAENSPSQSLMVRLSGQIALNYNLSMKEARLYSRKAMGAMPDVSDLDKLMGYALQLMNADQKIPPLN